MVYKNKVNCNLKGLNGLFMNMYSALSLVSFINSFAGVKGAVYEYIMQSPLTGTTATILINSTDLIIHSKWN